MFVYKIVKTAKLFRGTVIPREDLTVCYEVIYETISFPVSIQLRNSS